MRGYLNNILKKSVTFPFDKPIRSATRDFIEKCLKVEESDRISWLDIFAHPLIKDQFVSKLPFTISPLKKRTEIE